MKKLINKNIIKAMTIGISALMVANSMNLTAFAAEGDPVTDPATGTGTDENGTSQSQLTEDQIQLKADEAAVESGLTAALEEVGKVDTAVKAATEDIKEAADEAKTAPAQDVKDAAQTVLTELDNDNKSYKDKDGNTIVDYADENDYVGETEVPVDANEEAGDTKAAIDGVVTENGNINAAVEGALVEENNANAAVTDAEVAVGTQGSTVTIVDVVDSTTDLVNEAITEIGNATTVEEARAKRDAAIAAINQTDGLVNTSEGDFKKAQANFVAAEAALNAKVAEYEAAVARWDALKDSAEADLTACGEELKLLSADVATLKQEAADARAELVKEGKGKIADLEKRNAGIATPKWEEHRELCEAIIEYYYIPEILKGDVVYTNGNNKPATTWEKDWKSKGYGDKYSSDTVLESNIGDVLNYGIVKYTVTNETGEKETKELFYNYKLAEGNSQSSKGGIIIFEKVKHNVIGAEEIDDATLAKLDAGEAVFDDVNNATTVLVKETDADGKTVYVRYTLSEVGSERVQNSDITLGDLPSSTSDAVVSDPVTSTPDANGNYTITQTSTTTTTYQKVEIDGDLVTTYEYKDGQVVKVETGNLKTTTTTQDTVTTTTTTFTGNTLGGQAAATAKYANESVAKTKFVEALQDEVDKLNNDTLVIGSGDTAIEFKKNDTVAGKIAELQAKVDALEEGQSVVIGLATYTKGQTVDEKALGFDLETLNTSETEHVGWTYTVNVNFDQKFTDNIHITGTKKHTDVFNNKIDDDEAYSAFKDDVSDKVDTYRYYDGVFSDQQDKALISYSYSKQHDDTYSSTIVNKGSYWALGTHETYDRSYQGDLTVNYAKLSYVIVHKSWFVFTGSGVDNVDNAKKKLENMGYTGINVVDVDSLDDKGGKDAYTIYYYFDNGSDTVTIDADSTADVTNQAVLDALVAKNGNFVDDSNKDKINISSTSITNTTERTNQKPVTYYGYGALNYFIKTVSVSDPVDQTPVVGTPVITEAPVTVYETIVAKTQSSSNALKVEYRNDNWYNGNIILSEYNADEIKKTFKTDGKQTGSGEVNDKNVINLDSTDKQNTTDFRNWLAPARNDVDKYDAILAKVTDAESTIATAKTNISTLNGTISNLQHVLYEYSELAFIDGEYFDIRELDDIIQTEDGVGPKTIISRLIETKGRLDEAQKVLDEAISKRDDLLKLIANLNRAFDSKSDELTPAPTTPADEGGADEGGAVDGGAAVVLGAPAAPAAPVVVADGGVAVDDGDAAPVITEEIGDQEAALAETIPTDDKKIYDIINDPTALAELIEEPGVHIGWWWWLLIIAALGTTGWALYRKYKKNKAAEANGGKKDQK